MGIFIFIINAHRIYWTTFYYHSLMMINILKRIHILINVSLSLLPAVSPIRRYEEESDKDWSCGSWFEYLLVVILSTILLIGSLVLTIFWVIYYRGGFAWSDNPALQFNLHPVLMVAGFITFSGFCKITAYSQLIYYYLAN